MSFVNYAEKITFEESTRVNVAITIFPVKAQMNVYIERNLSFRNFSGKSRNLSSKQNRFEFEKTWNLKTSLKFYQISFLGTE